MRQRPALAGLRTGRSRRGRRHPDEARARVARPQAPKDMSGHMEFLVRQSNSAASVLPAEQHEQLRVAERARAMELRKEGILVKLWRVLGSTDSIALYNAPDADTLHEALVSLPMFPWMKFTVEPLVTHPQEKAL